MVSDGEEPAGGAGGAGHEHRGAEPVGQLRRPQRGGAGEPGHEGQHGHRGYFSGGDRVVHGRGGARPRTWNSRMPACSAGAAPIAVAVRATVIAKPIPKTSTAGKTWAQ